MDKTKFDFVCIISSYNCILQTIVLMNTCSTNLIIMSPCLQTYAALLQLFLSDSLLAPDAVHSTGPVLHTHKQPQESTSAMLDPEKKSTFTHRA